MIRLVVIVKIYNPEKWFLMLIEAQLPLVVTSFFCRYVFEQAQTYIQKKSLVSTRLLLSGWQDSNLRPPRPKRGAITGLRYTPK
jgi:hypothetical protein